MIKQVKRNVNIKVLYTYFGQKELLKRKQVLPVVYVDDCSPEPLEPQEGSEVYRIDTDKKWNQGGARNLGMSQMKGWVVMLDMDYHVTEENLKDLKALKKNKNCIYYLGREGEAPSYTVYLIHTDGFKKVGGYDEDFCGHYGYEDTEFNWRAKKKLTSVECFDIKLGYSGGHAVQGDRDVDFNKKLLDWKVNFQGEGTQLRFNWHKYERNI